MHPFLFGMPSSKLQPLVANRLNRPHSLGRGVNQAATPARPNPPRPAGKSAEAPRPVLAQTPRHAPAFRRATAPAARPCLPPSAAAAPPSAPMSGVFHPRLPCPANEPLLLKRLSAGYRPL